MGNMMLSNIGGMLGLVVIACVIVLLAMVIDLISGLHKAKIRGEKIRSWGLKRTITKFIIYEGAMLIASCIDVLIQLSNVLVLFGVDKMFGIPFVTCIVGIVLCIVEGLSVKEKADVKTQREIDRIGVIAKEIHDILKERDNGSNFK